MDLSQKIGQMIAIYSYGDFSSGQDPDLMIRKQQIHKFHIGAVIIGPRMEGPNLHKGTARQMTNSIIELQSAADIPLLVCADLERGLIARVADAPDFPSSLAIAATGNPTNSSYVGRATAIAASAVGIRLTLAPVADLAEENSNSESVTRSFGDQPEIVGQYVSNYISGAHSSQLLTAAKHFPGIGRSGTDSHFGNAVIRVSAPELADREFKPFRAAVKVSTDGIMLAHVAVPALDPNSHHVATTSSSLIATLRNELGFRGIVLTDALGMTGLTSIYPNDASPTVAAAIDAVKAGADMLLMPPDVEKTIDSLIDAVKKGEIPQSRIDDAAGRILQLKQRAGVFSFHSLDPTASERVVDDHTTRELAQKIADDSVVLLKNSDGLIPLPRNTQGSPKMLLVIFSDSDSSPLGRACEEEMRRRTPSILVRHVYYDRLDGWEGGDILTRVATVDRIVVAVFMTSRENGNNGPSVGTTTLMRQLLVAGAKKSIVVALGDPKLIKRFPSIRTYASTFSLSSTSEISIVKALYGEIQNQARLPLAISPDLPRGMFIQWPNAQ